MKNRILNLLMATGMLALASANVSAGDIQYAQYKQLQTGMTYQEVVKILGSEGEETSSSDSMGTKIVSYMWKDPKKDDRILVLTFSGGKLANKFQNGLSK